MKGTVKALAHAQESASALALDEQEYIEPVIVVPEGNVLARVAYADVLDVPSARELFLVDELRRH